ncbi:MAG: (1-_4)-alpha-D-glucan 1-alpha-D-glucosylmutase [Clostridiales bacterium]|nr:(1->4)-alpha-D-glucan 1-alpha-D-glucosylmutase [Clostridiales bacterium]MDN5282140.1 (1->4)-alpha-D-glucan 1-alpha-D-glucosylmutase [Candidatus Ozemobacter sp.]
MSFKNYPRATYRLQLNSSFNFNDVLEVIDYLKNLGISHVYLSPCLQATSGSTHGYDVVNHNRLNSDLGNKVDFALLCHRLEEAGMGIILDIVPNHMAISGPENPWWWDVLENGPSSQYSRYFDVDWHADSEDRSNLILLPILGDHYGIVLENLEFKVKHDYGKFTLNYYENVFPVAPRSLPIILELAYKNSGLKELGFLADAFMQLPHAASSDIDKIQKRQRDKAVLEDLLASLCRNAPAKKLLDEAVEQINEDCDKLDQLIGRQNYKLAYWKLSKYLVGYRRFFNINSLVGLRMEDDQVFNDSHRLVISLEKENKIDGFRVDHPDGLYDPTGYFIKLRRACPDALIFAEKILEQNENLNSEWPISGTTGYDFLNLANGLFIDQQGFEQLIGHWQKFSGIDLCFDELVYQKKKKIINDVLGSEINRLASDLALICENHRRYRDFGSPQLYQALTEVATGMEIYRTYIQPETGKVPENAQMIITKAIDHAREKKPQLGDYIYDFISDILLLKLRGPEEDNFVRRFQQSTGPIMAKSLEDTVFYIYNPLTSVNEVGSNPKSPATSVTQFHQWCEKIAKKWPLTMLGSSTHDTKRCEDVRARINLLSEIPDKWFSNVKKWAKNNAGYKTSGFPDANTEYLLYQTLVGCWPIERERISRYMEKAVREAKVHSNWFDPNLEFETSLMSFIERIYADENFISSLETFVKPLIMPGRINSLAQLTLKLTAPGVPDIYQGTERWDNSLTDPDNRRPVDFQTSYEILQETEEKNCREILHHLNDAWPKLHIIKTILSLRKKLHIFNEPDSYRPLEVLGPKADFATAFMRGEEVIVIVPRLLFSLKNRWSTTRIILPEGHWHEIFSDSFYSEGSNKIKDLLRNFPVAVLTNSKLKDWE